MFYCEYYSCNRSFPEYRSAAQHMTTLNHWAFECESSDCDGVFGTLRAASQHMADKGHWGYEFECETCDKEFQSPSAMHQHMTAVNHAETSYAHEMVRLDPSMTVYKSVKAMFEHKWSRTDKSAEFQGMFLNRQYAQLANGVPSGWRRLFHGTRRACRIGDRGDYLSLCDNDECSLCSILDEGFKIEHAGSANGIMYGGGIYSSPVSSKADNYVMNHHMHSNMHAMILCLAFLGTFEEVTEADHSRTGPSEGYNSVKAVVRAKGGAVEYTENIIYDEAAIIPVGLIMYTREGWVA